MKLLRNFDFADRYFDYESRIESKGVMSKICGWYRFIDNYLSALLVVDGNLYFLYGEKEILITDTHRVLIKENGPSSKEFILFNGNDDLVIFSYSFPDSTLNISPFEYIDEDDFKWGDFIEKIINDPERKKNFILNIMENY